MSAPSRDEMRGGASPVHAPPARQVALPPLPRPVVSRERLLQKMGRDEPTPAQLVMLTAPAGSGKTVLLSQWARHSAEDHQVCWANPASGVNLWESVLEAIGARRVGENPEATVTAWALELSSPVTLIVDNYELVTGPQIDEQVARLLAVASQLRVLVATRRATGLDARSAAAGVKVSTLDSDDLNFTGAEVEELATLLGLGDTGPARQILRDYEGWALAIHAELLARKIPEERRTVLPPIASGFYQSLPDSASKQALVLAGSLGAVTPKVLAAASGIAEEAASANLRELEENGLILRDLGVDGTSFRTRDGFIPFLVQLGQYWWSGSELERLGAAQAIELSSADPAQSLETLIKLGRFSDAERIAQQHFPRILEAGDRSLSTLRLLTPSQLDSHIIMFLARIVLERAQKAVPIETTELMARRLKDSVLKADQDGDGPSAAVSVSIVIAMERMLGNWEAALSLSNELYETLRSDDTADAPAILYTVLSLTGILTGNFGFAKSAAEAGYRVAAAQDNTLERVHALSLQALALVLLGDQKAAINQLARAEHLSAGKNLAPPEYSWVDGKVAKILAASRSGNVERGLAALARLTDEMERMEQWPLIVFAESFLTQRTQGPGEALMRMLQRLGAQPEQRMVSPFWKEKLAIRLADLEIANGRYQKAQEVLQEIVPHSQTARAAQARLAIFAEEYESGISAASAILAEPAPWPVRAEALLTLALCFELRGEYGAAEEPLRELAQNLCEVGTKEALLTVPTDLLIQASERAGETELAAVAAATHRNLRVPLYRKLSRAELRAIRGLAGTESMVQVAEALFISENTLKTHRRRIYQKLAASNRKEAVATAWRLGLLE